MLIVMQRLTSSLVIAVNDKYVFCREFAEGGRRSYVSSVRHIATILTLRLLMSYIYIYIYIYIYMEHLFLMFLDHTQRRTTVGRTPLDE